MGDNWEQHGGYITHAPFGGHEQLGVGPGGGDVHVYGDSGISANSSKWFSSLMNSSEDLGNASNSSSGFPRILPNPHCMLYDFLIEAVLMGVLCLFGFAGNILSVLCLMKDRSKTATPFLLVSLEVADTIFLLTVLILRVLTSVHSFTNSLGALMSVLPYVGKYVYPCALIAMTATIYLTVLVTLNRYISVCRPYDASDLCSVEQARKHVILVALFSILYNLPRFFEYQVVTITPEGSDGGDEMIVSALSPLGRNRIYQILYGNVMYFFVMFLVPLVTLIILNHKLIRALSLTRKKRAHLLKKDTRSKSEDDITLMLIVVVLVFVVCQTPALVTQVLLSLLSGKTRSCPRAFFYYERISDLLVVANSALNFIIYCFCSRKFRQILLWLVCSRHADSGLELSQTSKAYPTNNHNRTRNSSL